MSVPSGARRAPLDLLRLPLVRTFVRWRYARLALQLPLLALAALAIMDGLTGRQVAPQNVATVAVWLHYRGLVVLALLVLGNAFCAACPLMLTRGPTRWLRRFTPQWAWPRALRGKGVVLALTAAYLFAYEALDLWASPWLTAWLMIGYFGAALVVDTLFPAGTFCRHVCPLGNFNFALSHVSPTGIQARDPHVCATCTGRECVNGRAATPTPAGSPALMMLPMLQAAAPGCESRLFVPQMASNQDCTLCLNCVRACPHDNVALVVRSPLEALGTARLKVDAVLLGVVLVFAGLLNAFAMTPPYQQVARGLARLLGTRSEPLVLAVLLVLTLGAGVLVTVALTRWSSRLSGHPDRAMTAARHWGRALLPFAFAVWAGHYSFHFLTGWASLLPVTQQALNHLGVPAGTPDWSLAALVPENLLFPVQVVIVYMGAFLGALLTVRQARARGRVVAALPLLGWLLLLAAVTLWVLAQPMEMRGTFMNGSGT